MSKRGTPTGLRAITEDLKQYQLQEAEWITAEMRATSDLLHKYWSVYFTAVAAAVVWILGKLVDASANSSTHTLDVMALRRHPAICIAVCAIPVLSAAFTLMALEINEYLHSLARYREVLGLRIGAGVQIWRWEMWRRSQSATTFAWTASVNTFVTMILVSTTTGGLWFVYPATWGGGFSVVDAVWWLTVLVAMGALIAAGLTGIRSMRNRRVVPVGADWDRLQQA